MQPQLDPNLLTNLEPDDRNSILLPLAETACARFADFLNYHHELNDEDYRVRLDNWAYPARVLCAHALHPSTPTESTITLTILADPYGDEGGPSILTAFFDSFGPQLELRHLLQEFDTFRNLIITDGAPSFAT